MSWDDWGTWGGDVDIDVKREGDKVKIDFGDRTANIDRDNLNIDRDKMNINRDNLKNIDRSNIDVGNIDRSQISRDLRQNNGNRVTNRKPPQNAISQRPTAGNDVRRNVQSGLSQRPTASQTADRGAAADHEGRSAEGHHAARQPDGDQATCIAADGVERPQPQHQERLVAKAGECDRQPAIATVRDG